MVIKISDKAKDKLKDVVSEKDPNKFLKIYIAGYGWGGPSFGMALEESRNNDEKVEAEGFDFLIAEDLKGVYEKFTIDYSENWLRKGFTVSPH